MHILILLLSYLYIQIQNPPDFVKEAAHTAIEGPFNQYTRTAGHPGLVQLLAERYSRHLQRRVDPMQEVAITVGASQVSELSR